MSQCVIWSTELAAATETTPSASQLCPQREKARWEYSLAEISLQPCSPIFNNQVCFSIRLVISLSVLVEWIYFLSCCFKPVKLSFFLGTQKKIFFFSPRYNKNQWDRSLYIGRYLEFLKYRHRPISQYIDCDTILCIYASSLRQATQMWNQHLTDSKMTYCHSLNRD